MVKIKDYEQYVGADVIYELELYAAKLSDITIQNINSTAVGGGVAEILSRMIPLLQVRKERGIARGDRALPACAPGAERHRRQAGHRRRSRTAARRCASKRGTSLRRCDS